MKKNCILSCLIFTLVCGLSFTVTSCKEDDKDDNGGNGTDPELVTSLTDTDEAKAAYNWLANMTNIEEFTDNWASKTYEPTIGVESKNQANTRIVVVADIDYAKMNFASISGLSIDQLSTTQSQTIDGVGTITWTPSPAGANNLAEVDVNTKLIPHLSKIVYCTADQVGDNGSDFKGTAFYRFGDVIEDAEGYFWVCVKPAFGTGRAPQQQGYWINILNRDPNSGKSSKGTVPPIPTKNIKSDWNKKYNGNTILLPTSLGSTKEHVHNLSNLIWALLDPERYMTATGYDNPGLGGYDYKYNGRKFCERVAEQWMQKGIWEKLFNRSYEQMKQMKKLNFFYNGYHWNVGSTAGVWIAKSTKYEHTFTDSQKADDTLFEMKEEGAGFDIRCYCSDPDQDEDCPKFDKAGYAPAQQFTDTEGYWVVRQKTSSQIAGTFMHPSVYATLSNTAEIYRYNQVYSKVVGAASPVEEEGDISTVTLTPFKNRGFYTVGDVVRDENDARWFCVQPSTFGSDMSSAESNYAYFVSYDRIAVGGNDLDHIPTSRDLAAQMLFSLASWYHVGASNMTTSPFQENVANVKKYTEVDWYNLFAERDTLFKTSNNGVQEIACVFGSALYRNAKGEVCVLRIIIDCTKEQANGNRDAAWRFWDRYTADHKRTMLYEDLQKSETISLYAEDEWVYLPWFNPVTGQKVTDHIGKRPNYETNGGYHECIYDSKYHTLYSQLSNQAPTNMYREPLIAFAVKRVKDTGNPSKAFEDGTSFSHISLSQDYYVDKPFDMEDVRGLARLQLYSAYVNKVDYITLNDEDYDFKITNKP